MGSGGPFSSFIKYAFSIIIFMISATFVSDAFSLSLRISRALFFFFGPFLKLCLQLLPLLVYFFRSALAFKTSVARRVRWLFSAVLSFGAIAAAK